MSHRKREIYARAAVQLRTHDRAVRAEQLCPGAMGLYMWMLLQARGEESDGDVLEAAAVASWGAPAAFRRRQIEALIAVELVSRSGDRLVVVRYSEHNDDRATITANRNASAEKKRRQRHPSIANDHAVSPGDSAGTAPVVPISSSISISVSDLSGDRSRDPTSKDGAGFAPGTAGSEAARSAFESAVSTATGSPFSLARAPFHDRDLCAALNAHRPPDLASKGDVLRWMATVVALWHHTAEPQTLTPGKLLDWLNAGRPAKDRRGPGGGPRGDRQGLGGWRPPASTGTDDPFGGDP